MPTSLLAGGLGGGGGGLQTQSSSRSGDATNRGVNINGPSGSGSYNALAQFLLAANGSPETGGYTPTESGGSGLVRQTTLTAHMPAFVLFAIVGVGLWLLVKK